MPEIPDTRTRIQQIALTLFNENGYEATSLREIAEELGVTKAALYYHFKTKEDIVASLTEDRIADVQDLLDWARPRPRTLETRREIIHRYCEALYKHRRGEIMRFFERNQTALREHPTMGKHRELMLDLVAILQAPGGSVATRLKNSMALFALHAALMLPLEDDLTDEQRKSAALEVALELVSAE